MKPWWEEARGNDLAPAGLTWAEADPAQRAFDPATALAVVRGLGPAGAVPPPAPRYPDPALYDWELEVGEPWSDAMTVALSEHYGRWAVGWRWGMGESLHDGGVVRAWSGPAESITTPEATVTAVADALVEWHEWLAELAERFSRFLPIPDDASTGVELAIWERAVANLVTAVVDRTSCESGWQGMCDVVLHWFLTAAG